MGCRIGSWYTYSLDKSSSRSETNCFEPENHCKSVVRFQIDDLSESNHVDQYFVFSYTQNGQDFPESRVR